MGKEGEIYVLPRDGEEGDRLAAQHYMLAIALGALYHPKLGDLSQFDAILDNGAGTGIWLSTIAQHGKDISMYDIPFQQTINLKEGVILDGADISDEQFPNPLPKGISSMYVQDSLTPFPDSKKNKYDFVNQHYLALGLDADGFLIALKNVKEVIRPGGYICLQELIAVMHPPEGQELSKDVRTINRVFQKVINHGREVVSMDTFLPKVLEQAGFVDIDVHYARWDYGALGARFGPTYIEQNRFIFPRFFGAMTKRFFELGGEPGLQNEKQYQEVLQSALNDVMEKGLWWQEVFVMARKAT